MFGKMSAAIRYDPKLNPVAEFIIDLPILHYAITVETNEIGPWHSVRPFLRLVAIGQKAGLPPHSFRMVANYPCAINYQSIINLWDQFRNGRILPERYVKKGNNQLESPCL